MTGSVGYHAGRTAEAIVSQRYVDAGYSVSAQRWRGSGGEIDLIVEAEGCTVFVEVKKSKSHAAAAWRLGHRQQQRILQTAEEFLARSPTGLDTECRFDLALVNGVGDVSLLENVLGHG